MIYSDLNQREQRQAKHSLIALYGDMGCSALSRLVKEKELERVLKTKTFYKDANGYIFINL